MRVTIQELLDSGHFLLVCELEGLNQWMLKEGLDPGETVRLSDRTIGALAARKLEDAEMKVTLERSDG
jgi:hypothetical protein